MSPQKATPGALTSIGQVAITVTDIARAIGFYRDVLGLALEQETPEMAFFDCGSTRLMLGSPPYGGAKYNSIVYYRTDDIHAAVERLERAGVQFESQPRLIVKLADHDLWMAFFRDSEGNLAALMSESRLTL